VARRMDCGPKSQSDYDAGDPFAVPQQEVATVRARSVQTTVAIGAHAPCAIFISVLGLFTFASHVMPAAPWLAAALAADLVVIGTWPAKGGGRYRARVASDWLPMLFGVVALCSAVFLGGVNASVMEPWIFVNRLRTHTDVLPSDNSQSFQDAGVLHFATGAKIDEEASAGFRWWPNTYCAAPIRGPDEGSSAGAATKDGSAAPAPAPAALGFWAVGINCCDSRGGFTCGDASDAAARSGLRAGGNTEKFLDAVHMAAAANGEVASPKPVLLVWVKDPEGLGKGAWWFAIIVFMILTAFALGLDWVARLLLLRMGGLRAGDLGLPKPLAAYAASRQAARTRLGGGGGGSAAPPAAGQTAKASARGGFWRQRRQ